MNTTRQTFIPSKDKNIGTNIFKTLIDGVYFVKDSYFPDDRGFFQCKVEIPDLNSVLTEPFVAKQINQSRSNTNVIRGFHAESWRKLVTVTSGVAFCALADIRPDSTTFGNIEYFLLGYGQNALTGSIFLSADVANSMCVIDGPVDYVYCFDKLYRDRDKKGDQAVSLFDPDLNIEWPISKNQMIVSERDINSITLRELHPEKFR